MLFKKFLVTYSAFGKKYGCEYGNETDALENMFDIRGYEGITDVNVEQVITESSEIKSGPFEIK